MIDDEDLAPDANEEDLAPDANDEGDNEAPPELAELETHPDDIVPDNVDEEG